MTSFDDATTDSLTAGAQSFYIETWGCQMNDLDTQRLSGQLRLRGWKRVSSEEEADLVLLNTCSIREKAEQKVYNRLGAIRKLKGEKSTRIGVCGCVAQQEGEAILSRLPYVDFVMGPGAVGYLDDVLEGNLRVAVDFPNDRRYDHVAIDRPSPVKAQVTVIEGCNKNCTFCIVPTTRGREMSRPIRQVLTEVEHAVAGGRGEIELLGQTVNAYVCPVTGAPFGELLSQVASVEGVVRLRFVTSHPAEVDEGMIRAIRDHENISRYLHLPAQSGSSRVLRRMKRLYTRERYIEILEDVRAQIPDIRFSGDFIVGFPGETEDDFEQTLSLIEQVRYGALFAFCYSPRPGTAAIRMGDFVPQEVALERLHRLLALQERIEREILESYVGKVVRVLYDGDSRHDPDVLSGRTDDHWTVNFTLGRGSPRIGDVFDVRVDSAQHHSLRGEVVA